MRIHTVWVAQITFVLAKEVTVPAKYTDFVNIFLKKLGKVLLKRISINEHTIKLEKSKQLPYKPIYSFGQVELKIVKTYIETNLANGIILPSKSANTSLILFVWKPNDSLSWYFDYRDLNNFIIKN